MTSQGLKFIGFEFVIFLLRKRLKLLKLLSIIIMFLFFMIIIIITTTIVNKLIITYLLFEPKVRSIEGCSRICWIIAWTAVSKDWITNVEMLGRDSLLPVLLPRVRRELWMFNEIV